ncbi:hypothetical protein ACCQ23_15395 [Xanthomonas axonopodis pv. phyllanthi]|uniref:hypothetical protein n=1 Tax=Xanthomonas axonopodis TaxID=53413 RepID=UPI003557892E
MDFLRKLSVSLGLVPVLFLAACDQDAERQGLISQSQNSHKAADESGRQEKNSNEVLEPRAASKANATLTPDSESVDIQKLVRGFKEGMPYGDLRKKSYCRKLEAGSKC